MFRLHRTTPLLLCCLFAATGCGDPELLEQFHYEEATHGTEIEPSVDATALNGQILLLGQLNTPSACSSLKGDVERSGSQLTLRVTARQASNDCPAGVGNFRYQAAIRNLRAGTYQLRVRHVFEGSDWSTDEFDIPITMP